MSLDLGTMYALVTLDDSDYKRKLSGLEKSSESTFSKIAKAAAAYLTLRAVGAVVQKTVGVFSDLEEETQKFNVVFSGMGERTAQTLRELQKEFGLSELAAKRMLAGTGDMLTGFGFDKDLALTLSEGAAKLGADIASFSNYSGGAAGATAALTKAMLGEAESAKLLGVVIRQDSDEYKNLVKQAMTTGVTIDALGESGKNIVVSTEQQAKAVAALALAYQQSPNAIGDFSRSQDSIANQQRILQNNFEQTASLIGKDLSDSYRDVLGLANSLLKSYNELSPETRLLIRNTTVLTGAMLALSTTKVGAAILMYKGGIIGLAAGFKTAAIAAKGFFASIGPIGWAILALSGAFAVLNAVISANSKKIQENIKAAEKSADDSAKLNAQLREKVQTELSEMKRLEELARYERLSNAEKEEAEKILKKLNIAYDQNGRNISEMVARYGEETRSLQELIAAKKEQQKLERQKQIKQEIQARLKVVGANQLDTGLGAAFKREAGATWWGKHFFDDEAKANAKLNAEHALQYAAIEKLRQEYKELETGGVKSLEEIAKKAIDTRKSLESIAGKEWDIKFNLADASGKLAMLEEKIKQFLPGRFGSADEFISADRNSMTTRELQDLEKIISLEAQRKELLRQSADEFKREYSAHADMLGAFHKRADRNALEQRIRQADSVQAQAIMQAELQKAKESAKQLEKEYNEALLTAQEDSIYTAKERERVEHLRRMWQETLSDQERWQSRIDSEATNEGKRVSGAIGDWSAKVLAAQLGSGKGPEQETAQNTKKSWQILEEIRDNMGSGVSYT
jgi:hypothetical protein